MDTAILASELVLAVGFLIFIGRSVGQRIQELGLLQSHREQGA